MNRYTALAALALLTAGCGKGPYEFVPVSGRVTHYDQPLANVRVLFQPVDGENPGPVSVGTTDADGRFTLEVSSQQWKGDGAVPGKHRVSIGSILPGEGEAVTDPEVGSPDGAPLAGNELIPPQYNQDSQLFFVVPPGGTDQANFNLEFGRKPPKK